MNEQQPDKTARMIQDSKGWSFFPSADHGRGYLGTGAAWLEDFEALFPDLDIWNCSFGRAEVQAPWQASATALYLTHTTTSHEEGGSEPTDDAEGPRGEEEHSVPTSKTKPKQIPKEQQGQAEPQGVPASHGPKETAVVYNAPPGKGSASPGVEEIENGGPKRQTNPTRPGRNTLPQHEWQQKGSDEEEDHTDLSRGGSVDGKGTKQGGAPTFTIGTKAFTAAPSNAYAIAGQVLTPGAVITASNTRISLAPDADFVVVGTSTQALSPAQVAGISLGSSTLTPFPPNAFLVDEEPLLPGSIITAFNKPISLAPDGSFVVVGGTTQRLAHQTIDPAQTTSAPHITLGSRVYFSNSKGEYNIDGQILMPGGLVLIDGTTISLPTMGTDVLIKENGGTSTQHIASDRTGTSSSMPSQTGDEAGIPTSKKDREGETNTEAAGVEASKSVGKGSRKNDGGHIAVGQLYVIMCLLSGIVAIFGLAL